MRKCWRVGDIAEQNTAIIHFKWCRAINKTISRGPCWLKHINIVINLFMSAHWNQAADIISVFWIFSWNLFLIVRLLWILQQVLSFYSDHNFSFYFKLFHNVLRALRCCYFVLYLLLFTCVDFIYIFFALFLFSEATCNLV